MPCPAPPVPNTPPTSCPPLEPLTFPLLSRPSLLSALDQSRLAPHVAGLLTGFGSGNDVSPYVHAAAAALNGKNKCGILDIRIIVSLPLTAVL